MKKTALALLIWVLLACPRARAQEGGIGGEVFWIAGVILAENALTTLLVKQAGEDHGFPASYLPMYGYGMIGIVSAFYLFPMDKIWAPLVLGRCCATGTGRPSWKGSEPGIPGRIRCRRT